MTEFHIESVDKPKFWTDCRFYVNGVNRPNIQTWQDQYVIDQVKLTEHLQFLEDFLQVAYSTQDLIGAARSQLHDIPRVENLTKAQEQDTTLRLLMLFRSNAKHPDLEVALDYAKQHLGAMGLALRSTFDVAVHMLPYHRTDSSVDRVEYQPNPGCSLLSHLEFDFRWSGNTSYRVTDIRDHCALLLLRSGWLDDIISLQATDAGFLVNHAIQQLSIIKRTGEIER